MLNKKAKSQLEEAVAGILDVMDTDLIVTRGKDCETIYMNKSAKARLAGTDLSQFNCKRGYSQLFPDLCDYCPNSGDPAFRKSNPGIVKTQGGQSFEVFGSKLQWVDERAAVMLSLRDVSAQQETRDKLYNLAYRDALTGVPNRQRLKEDFEEAAHGIAEGRTGGLIAIFDLDNFKGVNDTYGHNTGDIMLRRLTEHLSGSLAFAGHLYRLGGDEFVLLYTEPAGRHGDEEECRAHYEKLLSGAFMSYTMPNIEASCTISMGAAFFPLHGNSYSELLRKADIALYKAKENGRNCLVFFEDQYDTAKKFKDLFINIQPILTQHGRSYGYELVDRGNADTDENAMNLAEFDRTLDALNLGDMDNDAKYFIAFTNQLLSKTVLNHLPRDKFVIQIRLDAPVGQRQMEKFRELKASGYTLALSGLSVQSAVPELVKMADFIKFAPEMGGSLQKKFITANPGKKFIATGVDTAAAFEKSRDMGFLLFQGYFFEEPVVLTKTKDIDPMKVNYLRLLKLTSTDEYVNFQEISQVISSDVALSYKLLRLLNSAAVGLRNKISSIDMGVAYLGEEHLKKWIALLAMRGVAADKPLELVRISLIRAQFGELLAPYFKPPKKASQVFLTGMFSLLHIALEKSREELLKEIPVAEDIRNSLLTTTGLYSDLLDFYTSYEYANWDEVSDFARKNSLPDRVINEAYIAAVKWFNDLSADLR